MKIERISDINAGINLIQSKNYILSWICSRVGKFPKVNFSLISRLIQEAREMYSSQHFFIDIFSILFPSNLLSLTEHLVSFLSLDETTFFFLN